MTRKIISVSISEEEFQTIQELNLSPSELIQAKVQECMVNQRMTAEAVKEIQRRMNAFKELAEKYRDFLEKKGLVDEFFGINNVVQ